MNEAPRCVLSSLLSNSRAIANKLLSIVGTINFAAKDLMDAPPSLQYVVTTGTVDRQQVTANYWTMMNRLTVNVYV